MAAQTFYWLTKVICRIGILTTGRIPSIGVPTLENSWALVNNATPSCNPPKEPLQKLEFSPTKRIVPIGKVSKSPKIKGTVGKVNGVKGTPNSDMV